MSFHITVRRPDAALPPAPPSRADQAAFDVWLAECRAGELYSNPLGGNGTVHRWWYTPARRLALSLLSRVYPDGLDVSGDELAVLTMEVDALERDWLGSRLESEPSMKWIAMDAEGRRTEGQITLAEHLRERAGYLRQAVATAQTHASVVSIF